MNEWLMCEMESQPADFEFVYFALTSTYAQ